MYTWGYIKDCTLMKLDLSENEANNLGLLNRFPFYANEAMTQICSTVKPNRRFKTFDITEDDLGKEFAICGDFISFNDDINTFEYVIENVVYSREALSDDFSYEGYNRIKFFNVGKYRISYNARWYTFTSSMDDKVTLPVPADVLDCITSYIAHQCYKMDDEYKSSVFRNEYEIALARLDNTDYKSPKTIHIGGDW